MRALDGDEAPEMLAQYLPQEQLRQLFGSSQGDFDQWNARNTEIAARMSQIDAALKATTDPAQKRALQAEKKRLSGEQKTIQGNLETYNDPRFSKSGAGGAGGGGYMQKMKDLLSQFDNLAALSGFGDQRKATVDRDIGRMANKSNASIAAMMRRSGLSGSSYGAQALAGNAKQLAETAGDRKASIDDQIMALMQGTRNANIDRMMSRLGGRTNVESGVTAQSQSFRREPIQAEMNMLFGPAFAPFANKNTGSYFQPNSAAGYGQTALGATVGGLGSNIAGAGLNQLMSQLFSNSGSTRGGLGNLPNGVPIQGPFNPNG